MLMVCSPFSLQLVQPLVSMADASTLSVKERMLLVKKQHEEVAAKSPGESYVKMTRGPPPSHSTLLAQPPLSSSTQRQRNASRKAPPPPQHNAAPGLSGPSTAPMPIAAAPRIASETEQGTMPPLGSSYPEQSTPLPLSDTQRPHSVSSTPPTLRRGSAPLTALPTAGLPPVPNLSKDVPPPIPNTPRPHIAPQLPPSTYSSPPMLASQLQAPDAPPLLYPKGVKQERDAECPPEIPRRPVELPPPPPGRKSKPPPYKSISDAVALKDFVSKHKLPQMVRVVAGIYDSMEEKRTMPTGINGHLSVRACVRACVCLHVCGAL